MCTYSLRSRKIGPEKVFKVFRVRRGIDSKSKIVARTMARVVFGYDQFIPSPPDEKYFYMTDE